MKKYIFFIILLFIPIFINAQTCDIEKITIENIEVDKINEMSQVINQIESIEDFEISNSNYTNEDEYLCYLNEIIYNLENKIGNVLNKS